MGRRVGLLSCLSALLVLGLMSGALTAQAKPSENKTFLVTVQPATTAAGTPTDFTVTITNTSSTTQLGGVRLDVPSGFTINTVGQPVAAGGAKFWTSTRLGSTNTIDLTANSLTDRVNPGQSVVVVVNATSPSNTNSGDTTHDWLAVGRQANNFNDQMGGNDVFQVFENRAERFDIRRPNGTTATNQTLGTHQTLVTGVAVNCASAACRATVRQYDATITVSADCGAGTLVVDVDLENILADGVTGTLIRGTGFYNYFGGDCTGRTATIDLVFPSSVASPGSLKLALDYDGKTFPGYVGDGQPLPRCGQSVTVNCVSSVSGGPGVVNAQVKAILTDPRVGGFT